MIRAAAELSDDNYTTRIISKWHIIANKCVGSLTPGAARRLVDHCRQQDHGCPCGKALQPPNTRR